ncbi:MAG: flagellar basal body-associated protein FliL [Betaproteobacteria bacterium]|nr:flagellar basal body-associated protein FliL [Betaproteobacteria bacterium]
MSKAAAIKPGAAPAEGGEAPKKKGKLLVIIIAAVVLLVAAGGAAMIFMSKKHAAEGDEEDAPPAKEARGTPGAPPVFVHLEPFTVNLQPEHGEQYLQVIAVMRVEDAKVSDATKQYMPELRHRVLMLLSRKKASEISGPDGRETLADEIRGEANEVLSAAFHKPAKKKRKGKAAADDEGPVESVFFTSFIIQ